MKLAELIDLEVQLLRDEQAVSEGRSQEIAKRDRALGHQIAARTAVEPTTAAQDLAEDRKLRHEVCGAWLQALPKGLRRELPGTRIERGYRIVGWLLFGVFCLMGIGTAMTALHGTDQKPVNVLVFIVVFFGLQILLLAMYPVFLLVRRLRGGGVLPWLSSMIMRLSRIRWLDKLTGQTLEDLPETLHQLQSRQVIYGTVQQWMLFTFVQRMAMGFNLSAFVTSLGLLTFTDLPFCWSTTLDIQPTDLHTWLTWIAAPWSFLGEFSAPTEEAIQYSRFVTSGKSGYLAVPEGIDAVQLRRTWWPFLIAGLITWGLLPRAIAFVVGCWRTDRSSSGVPLNHMAVQHLFERLYPPTAAWSGPDPDDVRGAAPEARPGAPTKPMKADPSAACHLVCWGTLHADHESVEAHVGDRFHRNVEQTLGAGLADVDEDVRTIAALTRAKARRVVLAMPEGQQPTKDVTRFLAGLRENLGAECEIVVGLLARGSDGDGSGFTDVDGDEIEAWRTKLLAAGDPYLTLQTMGHGA